ncbi:MORN repeat-containing protein [Paenibacillus sp. UNC451MF]|uniref:MORN repeat-containing protein n=1 Tax=Paenibacillus sp. UNC451MF TaxID=1449063 RepID=UPI00068D10B8|nr:hypothetical protein [Paenibacillus sp. UNC451MF]
MNKSKSNFDFMQEKLPELYALAANAEQFVDSNPLLSLNSLQRLGRSFVTQIIIMEELSATSDEPMTLLETLICNEIIPPPFVSLLKQLEYFDPRESELLLDLLEVKRLLFRMYDLTEWFYKTYIDDRYVANPLYMEPQNFSLASIKQQEYYDMKGQILGIDDREYATVWRERIENEQHVEINDQESYQGQIWNGLKHGEGVYCWPDGTRYLGQWSRDVEHGVGVKHFANGDSYQGDWKDGLFHGKGTYKWKDGAKFEGHWEYNLEHGYGVQTRSDGTVRRGLWTNGELVINQDQLKE